jgi:dCMP deaminase
MIIGVTGFFCAGKDEFANYITSKGIEHISLSDILREDLIKAKIEVTRTHLQELGKDLRLKYGAGILAERALKSMPKDKNYLVSSIGTTGEAKALRKRGDFLLVFIDAPQNIRFERMKARNRENDPKTFDEFRKQEAKETKGGGSAYREIENLKKIADVVIVNDGSLDKFKAKIDKMLHDHGWKYQYKRPSWDEYFMSIVDAVAKRGTCDRGRTGCIIVKDKRILATGYAGSPAGMKHCDEIGHLMKTVFEEDGSKHAHCVRTVHGEANAIAQAAKYGISIDGSTIYMKLEPCLDCAKLIINAGIKRVVCEKRYHGAISTRKFFEECGVKLDVLSDEFEKYFKQS